MPKNPDFKKYISQKTSDPKWRFILILVLSTLIIYSTQIMGPNRGPVKSIISYSEFISQLNNDNVQSVIIQEYNLKGEFKDIADIFFPEINQYKAVKHFQTALPLFLGEDLIVKLSEKKVLITVESSERLSPFWQFIVGLLPWVIIIGIWLLIMRSAQKVQGGPGGLFSFGASKAKLHNVEKSKVTFKDVAGMENGKLELKETVEFLRNPERFRKLGAKVPRGVLLIGPPGTGKTLLARAIAGEAEVPFYSISASEFIEMFVGVGASRVRDMFLKAKAAQPSIIFIDEIDAVGRTRGAGLGGGSDEREQTLNQLLSELDGFDKNEEVIVIAATNRPDVLDPALLRPGRFDRHIVIDKPGVKDRKAILAVHVANKVLSDSIDLEIIAKGTPGMTGADLENLANEAALIATRKNKDKIEMDDFDEARDKIFMGTVRDDTISDLERRITAFHEAGHALVAFMLPGSDPIHKVSIVPRGMAMGVTQLLPEEDRHYYPKSYLMNKLSVALAGRVAEKIIFNDLSTGAQSDLKEASSLAEKMVAQWGMSEKVGPISLGRGEEHPFLGRELSSPKHYSEDMAWLMDQEIRRLIVESETRANEILETNKNILIRLSEELLKEEVLDRSDVERIIKGSAD